MIGHNAEVSTQNVKEFDPRGQYKAVIEAVEKVGDGKARIYRISHGKTRAEYYIVGLDKKGERVVGMKASSVET